MFLVSARVILDYAHQRLFNKNRWSSQENFKKIKKSNSLKF
jgi:hypothetical protein